MSWEELSAIYADQAMNERNQEQLPPVACPNDGTPLDVNSGGVLHCPFDGWMWDGNPVRYDN